MTSSDEPPRSYSRRFFWLAVAIVAVVGAYTAGWHYLSGVVVDKVNASVTNLNRDGMRASCENTEARGYPFRIGVFCRSVMFENARAGVRLYAREFRSAAQIYNPWLVLGELDGPARIEAPGLHALEVEWESLRGSVRVASPQPERISLEGRNVAIGRDEPGDATPLYATAQTAEFHSRPNEAGNDIAVRFSELALDPTLLGSVQLPPLNGLVDVAVNRWGTEMRGSEMSIRTLAVSLSGREAGVTVNGPLSIGEDGLIDANLQITLRDPAALSGVLLQIFPDKQREISLGLAGMAAMGDAPTVPLRIENGQVTLGFFALGVIPPL